MGRLVGGAGSRVTEMASYPVASSGSARTHACRDFITFVFSLCEVDDAPTLLPSAITPRPASTSACDAPFPFCNVLKNNVVC